MESSGLSAISDRDGDTDIHTDTDTQRETDTDTGTNTDVRFPRTRTSTHGGGEEGGKEKIGRQVALAGGGDSGEDSGGDVCEAQTDGWKEGLLALEWLSCDVAALDEGVRC